MARVSSGNRIAGKINGEYRDIHVDSATHGMLTVDHVEAEVHDGHHFAVSGYETEASAGAIEFIVVTPDTTEWAHMSFFYNANKAFHFQVYEGATFDAGTGTLAVPVNSDRNSSHTSSLEVRKDPDNVATGAATLIDSFAIGVSAPGQPDLGGSFQRIGLILKQNTTYLFCITSDENDNVISYKGSWGEHVNES